MRSCKRGGSPVEPRATPLSSVPRFRNSSSSRKAGNDGNLHSGWRRHDRSEHRATAAYRRHGHSPAPTASGGAVMTPEGRGLLLLLRQVQWWMDEAALDIPRDAYSVGDHIRLADGMEQLAHA